MHLELKNSEKKVKLCRIGFRTLKKEGKERGWRLHSEGYAVLQYTQFGKIKTLYLHKYLASKFVEKPQSETKLFVRLKNNDKLDCRIDNLEWVDMSELRRSQTSSALYRGVSKDGTKYRSILYDHGERIYLGLFETAEEAAKAYDEESLKRFGPTKSLNF